MKIELEKSDRLPPRMWGVWVPAEGWLKVQKPDFRPVAFSTLDYDMALVYARWRGDFARVEPIDQSLATESSEAMLLKYETLPALMRLRNWVKNNISIIARKAGILWIKKIQ